MKRIILTLTAAVSILTAAAAPAGRLLTPWGEKVDTVCPWREYPRPNMQRGDWSNLNGRWDYAIRPRGEAAPASYDGKILVPFAVESALSGVEKKVGHENELWYRRSFDVPSAWRGRRVMLNFGAVDWKCDVWVNGTAVGGHEGGFAPFGLDITDALKSRGANEVVVRVYDPTDRGPQARGKQVSNPEGIWYSPVTGIWQTVWLEPVAERHIASLRITPDVDANVLRVVPAVAGGAGTVTVAAYDGKVKVAEATGTAGAEIELKMPADVKLWSPDSPHLYDLDVRLSQGGKTLDRVSSYAAMRKLSVKRGEHAVMRFQLNDRDIYHFGPLDQGWWPDGLYTAPSYEAMVYDVDKTKELGYNMIRKHVKVEPALWYAYCDRAGILVWQDMPSGDNLQPYKWNMTNYYQGQELQRSDLSDRTYRKEWAEIMDALHNYPSIAVWVPFNEAWGQYNTVATARWTKEHDPSRLVNSASGGNHFECGDILDVHRYPAPELCLLDYNRANVVGEYGGIGYAIPGHLWNDNGNWGYTQFKSPDDVTREYLRYIDILTDLSRYAYTGAVYTQTTDVEGEVNGLMTYDRRIVKVNTDSVARANRSLIQKFSAPR